MRVEQVEIALRFTDSETKAEVLVKEKFTIPEGSTTLVILDQIRMIISEKEREKELETVLLKEAFAIAYEGIRARYGMMKLEQ